MLKHKLVKRIIKTLVFILLIFTLPYYKAVFYTFNAPSPFEGSVFYNPYEQVKGKWIKANFHAHSELLFGLTNGENTAQQMYSKYDSLNYDLPCLSNYNSLTQNSTNRNFYMNAYEHGFNVGFTHQLVLNSKTASKFDYPLFQFTSHKQHLINRLKTKENLVALAHPKFKVGYSFEDLALLKNYDLMEIISPRANSAANWDKALSSGKMVWGIGNDDSHDDSDGNCGISWTMVNVEEHNKNAVIKSLKNGNCYTSKGWQAQEMQRIKKVNVTENVYALSLDLPADSILLKSDNGKTVAIAINSTEIRYKIKPENTYIRAEIFETEPWNKYTKIYLNPVIRTKNGEIKSAIETLSINYTKTFIYFLLLIGFDFLLGLFILKW